MARKEGPLEKTLWTNWKPLISSKTGSSSAQFGSSQSLGFIRSKASKGQHSLGEKHRANPRGNRLGDGEPSATRNHEAPTVRRNHDHEGRLGDNIQRCTRKAKVHATAPNDIAQQPGRPA